MGDGRGGGGHVGCQNEGNETRKNILNMWVYAPLFKTKFSLLKITISSRIFLSDSVLKEMDAIHIE